MSTNTTHRVTFGTTPVSAIKAVFYAAIAVAWGDQDRTCSAESLLALRNAVDLAAEYAVPVTTEA